MYLFKLVSLSEFVAASQLLCIITDSYLLFSLGTIPKSRQQKNWVSGFRKSPYLVTFSSILMGTADGWVGQKNSKTMLT